MEVKGASQTSTEGRALRQDPAGRDSRGAPVTSRSLSLATSGKCFHSRWPVAGLGFSLGLHVGRDTSFPAATSADEAPKKGNN